jgi:hypothetical protein
LHHRLIVDERNRRPLHYATPDFLLKSLALAYSMRPSLRKAAHVGIFGAARQEIRVRYGPTARRGRRDDKSQRGCLPQLGLPWGREGAGLALAR